MSGSVRRGPELRARRSSASLLLSMVLVPSCVEIDPSYGESYTTSADGSGTMTATGSDGATGSGGATDDATSVGTGPVGEANVAFVTTAQFNGAMGGLAGADMRCQEAANAAGLPGTYVAWLADSTQDAASRLGSASGWVRTDGQVWATDRNALISGLVAYPLLLTETGAPVPLSGVAYAYTGAEPMGQSAPEHCNDWQSADVEASGRVGYVNAAASRWSAGVIFGCDFMAHLLCLGIDLDAPVPIPPPAPDSRVIFNTAGGFAASAGRDVADDLCASEATAAELPGTFLALVAAPGEALFDRHTQGGDIVRADGALVFPGSGSPAEWNNAIAPPVLGPSGLLGGSELFFTGVGTTTEVASMETTCQGWSDPADKAGTPQCLSYLTNWLTNSLIISCDTTASVLCLQQ